jgi:transcriptional regulator with PAS, ATPase and Fis domain
MSSPRTRSTELVRLFQAARQPIYVLDEELTIVFLNRACQEWLAASESLVGRRCAYHSSLAATGPDALAAGLCPPPEVLAGKSAVATISRGDATGRPDLRRARFVPLGLEGEGLLGVVAIVEAADRPPAAIDDGPPVVADGEAESGVLHEHIRRFRQEAAAQYRADRLIGEGPAMRLARRQVELAAQSGASVLLIGPPGSGRRHLAAAIHYGVNPPSPELLTATLVPLDCGLLGPDLLEEVVAAVTRARLSHDKAAPGTLLLHRVDETSSDMQVELAGLLVRRPLSWRLIATAGEPLAELARRGKFRADLAAALSTIVIELPALARRREDLPLLAQLFLEELNAAGQRQIGGFTPAALDLLDSYGWPGNLDELAEVVAESHRRAAGREIDVADLPERLRLVSQAAAHPPRSEETIVLGEYLSRVERELIRRALARAKGNKSRAARLLGLTRPRLYRRMVQLGLE